MLRLINRIFIAIVLLLALSGILLSIATLFLPAFLDNGPDAGALPMDGFSLVQPLTATPSPSDSPLQLDMEVRTPPLLPGDLLFLDVYAENRLVSQTDCLGPMQDYARMTEITCAAAIPYDYSRLSTYEVYAVLTRDGIDYQATPVSVAAGWSAYEANFMALSWVLALIILAIALLILLPITLAVILTASRMKHNNSRRGEYTHSSLVFLHGRTLYQKFESFLISPYFWAFESIGILIILAYMAVTAQVWKSPTALIAFLFSGVLSFIVPYVWCVAWWYADYREREPLRIMVTFFLWGMLAALMAIGINTILGALVGWVGLGFLGSLLLAPPLEELYKGAGLALMGEHHEYDSIEDGIAFGFAIGMGFSFIENWIYLLDNPMGSDIWGWLSVFILRSINFSTNHGFFTAITGAVIGWLIERNFKAPALGLLVGVPVAAFFHAMHNSGETIIALIGGLGSAFYCCLLIPFFDYGGFIILVALFIRAVIRKRSGRRS